MWFKLRGQGSMRGCLFAGCLLARVLGCSLHFHSASVPGFYAVLHVQALGGRILVFSFVPAPLGSRICAFLCVPAPLDNRIYTFLHVPVPPGNRIYPVLLVPAPLGDRVYVVLHVAALLW